MIKAMIATALMLVALNTSAACSMKRPGEAPLMPDGAVASKEAMYEAQLVAESYILLAEAYMDCKVMNSRQHRALAARVSTLAEQYDEEMTEFRVRTSMVAVK